MRASKTPSPPAVDRAFAILEALAESPHGLAPLELKKRLALPKSSTHCLVVGLERLGYIHRSKSTGRYLFGLKLFGLTNAALKGLDVHERAAPHMYRLMQSTRLTVHMGILEGDEVVLVKKTQPPGMFRLAAWVGKRMEVHCAAIGKAIIGFLPDDRVERIVRERGLPRHNENTICNFKSLRSEFLQIRKHGYAVDNEEDEIGIRCLGAPVFGPSGEVVAGISVAGTTSQIRPDNESALARAVVSAAAAISGEYGYRVPAPPAGPGLDPV